MPASIDALLLRADLGMTLLAGAGAPGVRTPIRWVTTSELLDPTPYLRGGELLLTTGMRLPSSKAGVAQYVSRLATAEVVGLGLGVGMGLAFRAAPERLIAAADEHGLPLLVVDEPTPFIAIGEAVAQLHLADETAALGLALRGQQAITRAAVTAGAAGVVRRLAVLIDGWVVVADSEGRVLHEHPPGSGTLHLEVAMGHLERLRDGRGSSAALVTPDEYVTIQVIGEARAAGAALSSDEPSREFLATGSPHPPTTAHHSMSNVAVALLTVIGTKVGFRAGAPAEALSGRPTAHQDGDAIRDSLARYSRRSPVRLAESLRVWLAHHGRIEPAAAELGIHRNTLRYRIMKAERLLGRDLDDPAARAELWAALTD